MPVRCYQKSTHGSGRCLDHCPVTASGVVETIAIERAEALPPAEEDAVDVAVLDMHHEAPSLGFDSILYGFQDAVCDFTDVLETAGLRVRLCTYDVRTKAAVPVHVPERFALYVGSGGPGHIDPEQNDGVQELAQGIQEDPRWLPAYRRLLDAIGEDGRAAYLAICHSFGLLLDHFGVAKPSLRGPEKGGKCSGVREVHLTGLAAEHPWFQALYQRGGPGRIKVLDNRLFDLLPAREHVAGWVLGLETLPDGGPPGDAITMVEFARDRDGVLPRVFGMNYHPEIVGKDRYALVLEQKKQRGNVSEAWYRERLELLNEAFPDEAADRRLRLTSDYTFVGPLRFHLYRALRERLARRGLEDPRVHEARVYEQFLHDPQEQAASLG